jgi:hypothetical protein
LVLEYLEKTLYGKKQQFTETNFQTTLKWNGKYYWMIVFNSREKY